MSFREKSAWGMLAVMVVTGLFYLNLVRQLPADAPAILHGAPLIPYVVAVVVLSIIVQVVLAIASPKEADTPADEREKPLIDKAGHWSGVVLGVGVIWGMLDYFWTGEGNRLLYFAMGGLILSQIAEYAFQIWLFRRGY